MALREIRRRNSLQFSRGEFYQNLLTHRLSVQFIAFSASNRRVAGIARGLV